MLLIDGVRYEEWLPEGPRAEEELEQMVKEHAQDIFGENLIYFDKKQKLKSLAGVGSIPDGLVIMFANVPQWHIVEIELSTHQLYDHIVNQVGRFINGVKNTATQKKIIEAIYHHIQESKQRKAEFEDAIGSGEIYKFLSDLITKPPVLVIIIEKRTPELDEALDLLKYSPIEIVEFQTFTREGVGLAAHAHLFEPLYKYAIQPSIPIPLVIPPVTSSINMEKLRKGVEQVTVKDLIEANIIKVGQVIYKLYKGQKFEGKVLNDGSIELAHTGKKCDSLSMAAVHITGINENGWRWWHTTRANGTECLLDELRKEYKSNPSP